MKRAIRAEQVRLLYANAVLAVVVTLVAALILSQLQWKVVAHSVVLLWLAYMAAVSLGRLALEQIYRKRPRGSQETGKWAALFLMGTGLAAAGWGTAGIVLYPEGHLVNQVFLVFVVGGMMVGGASVLGARVEAFVLFIVVTGLPVTVRLFVHGDEVHRNMALLAALYIAATLITAWRVNSTLLSSLKLRFKNQDLLASLRDSKDRAEALNAELTAEVAERKRAAEALEAAIKELEAFSYSVSHDLRAPLRAINGFAQILIEEHGHELTPQARRYLDHVRQGGVHMGRLVDDLLAFLRLGRQDLKRQPVRIDEIVRLALEDLGPAGEGVRIVVGDLPSCEADPLLLRKVFANLLSNAIRYTRSREQPRIEVGTLAGEQLKRQLDSQPAAFERGVLDTNMTVFYVRDNGIGFDMRYAGKLFGVFQRLHNEREFEGTGVGLATVRRIIDRHGGRVWAESEVDKGAAFFFTLGAAAKG